MEMTHSHGTTHAHGTTDALFDGSDATHVAVSSGAWTDPGTWQGGRVPGEGAKVHIPEGIEVRYNSTSKVELEVVRVDGALDFATNQNTYMLVESIFTGVGSRFTVGTEDNPVNANVNADIVFADNRINLSEDPDQLGHGLVAEGTVEIVGATKTSYTTLESSGRAGTKTLELGDAEGWAVGDTIVVMGTVLDEYQDEYRTITAIKETSDGITVTLDRALSHNHTTPPGHDLDIYVGNSSRNVEFTSENPEGVRGHVMLMHTSDVVVKYAEFDELGRTDKSRALDVNGNEAGRYSLHLHETGTDADSGMAILYGNSVHGSPGWGIVQHSSTAAVDFNFVHNIDGAGIVSEDGDEQGQWIGNFVTGVAGVGKFSRVRAEEEADFGFSGVAYENQARQIVQQGNIAANSVTGWMFRAAEVSVDNPDRDALQFDPAPFKNVINNEEAAVIGFHDNVAVAVETVVDTGHRVDVSTSTDLRSDFIGLVAWEVETVLDVFSYSAEYVIRDGLFIGGEGADNAFRFPEKHESTSIINSHIENFREGIFDVGVNNDGVYIGLTFKDVKTKIRSPNYGEERLLSSSAIKELDRPILQIDSSSDLTMGKRDGGVYITGTITDSAGTLELGSNRWLNVPTSDQGGIDSKANVNGNSRPAELIAVHGAMRDGNGGWIMPVALWITDRVTGEHFAYRIDIELVGYTDEYLEKYEITEFSLPSSEIVIVDSENASGGGTSNQHAGHGGGHNGHQSDDSGEAAHNGASHSDDDDQETGGHTSHSNDDHQEAGGHTNHSDDASHDDDIEEGSGHSGGDGRTNMAEMGSGQQHNGPAQAPAVDADDNEKIEVVQDVRDQAQRLLDNLGSLSEQDAGPVEAPDGAVLELGRSVIRQQGPDMWMSVTFEQEIPNAVVIMGPVTNTGAQPAFARVRNVTDNGFEFQIEEWDYDNGKHRPETVSWLALSEGEHTLADGRGISAAVVESDVNGDASIDLGPTDAVLAQVGSDNNDDAVHARTKIDSDGDIAIDVQRQESATGNQDAETVFVVALDAGDSSEFEFVSGSVGGINHTKKSIDFGDSFDDVAFIGAISSIRGRDTAALRLDDTDDDSATVFLQEETSRDWETRHAQEKISFVAGDVGVYELF